jgi:hypothetical protein
VKNKIVHDVVDFVKGHQLLIDQVLREDVSEADELTMEQINLVVSILSKVMVLKDLFWASLILVSGFMQEILFFFISICKKFYHIIWWVGWHMNTERC